jgi:hypothetical protein
VARAVSMRRAARVDNTAKALTAAAKQLGARILVINGTIDCVLETPRGHYLLVRRQQRTA